MALPLSFPLQTKAQISLKGSGFSKARLPSVGVKASRKISERANNLPVLCSVRRDGTTTTTVKESEAVPAWVVLRKSSFPPGFTFGTASSAYQVESATDEGGRGPCIWDTFAAEQPDKITDGKSGKDGPNTYHKYKEDIQLMKQMGVDTYRFSISWSRILPDGTGDVNPEGIKYYNNLINELIDNGITPFVTIFHWDTPQALENRYGGFRSRDIVKDFVNYVDICFKNFGDRVKNWITINEPWSYSTMGHCLGWHAPGRCSSYMGCPVGDSTREPYIVAHNLILAHAYAVKHYRHNYQALQRGKVGITINSTWYKPLTESLQDKQAADRCHEFFVGWFMDPLFAGDYPFSMRAVVRDRLPVFDEKDKAVLRGSYDFIGVNYYSSRYATENLDPISPGHVPDMSINDRCAYELEKSKDGELIGELHGDWVYVVPDGLRELLLYIKDRYNNPIIYITENGTVETDNPDVPIEEAIQDPHRSDYLKLHLAELLQAINAGANVKGYFAWSIMDNYEWHKGYTERFGLYYIDYNEADKTRYAKSSVDAYKHFLES